MKALRAFIIWLTLLILLAALSWGFTLYMEWPIWAAPALFLGTLGAYFLVRFIVRMVQVYRSRTRMAQLSKSGQTNQTKSLSPQALLTRKWTVAVATLRASSLRRFGNPLYVLPWYMVVGRAGTGKTTALTRSRLSSSLQKVNQSAKVEHTANYDWWYFDRAVVIDCAGRYVEAADLDQDRNEWELGLDLLAKYRGREGLNGLVLAISSDRLAVPDKDALADEGRVIRDRIEQLIRLFGKRFPIYILITQCDRIYGLEEWSRRLPEKTLEQAMGFVSEPIVGESSERQFLDTAFQSIGERLKLLRTELLAQGGEVTPELLLFPDELLQLKSGINVFLRACLGDSAYLESPFLRGLFFSSGLQAGGAVSSLLTAVLPPTAPHSARNIGIFLHDFFGKILPQDRNASLPVFKRNPWRAATQNLGIAAWLLISCAVAIFITVSFFQNMETLASFQDKSRLNMKFVGRIEPDVATLERLSDSIVMIESRNDSWINRWMVDSTNIDDMEESLKLSFTDNFRKYVLPIADANYEIDSDRTSKNDAEYEFPRLVRNLVRYINLLKARQLGSDRAALLAMPQRQHVSRYTPEFYGRLNKLYISNIAWAKNGDSFVSVKLRTDQQLLNKLAFKDSALTWLVGLPISDVKFKTVTVEKFWGKPESINTTLPAKGSLYISEAYTRAGRKEIDSFLVEMEKSIDDGPKFVVYRDNFDSWYKAQRLDAWLKFISGFPGSEKILSGELEWRAALGAISTSRGAYFKLLDGLVEEFAVDSKASLPSWVLLARELSELRLQAARSGVAGEALNVVGTINTVGGKAMKEVLAGATKQGEDTVTNNLSSVSVLQKLTKDMGAVSAEVSAGPGKAYQVASDFHGFSVDPTVKTSSLHAATDGLISLRKLVGYSAVADEAVWQLFSAPLRFILSYTEEQASCSLQSEWAAKVDFPLQTVPTMAAMVDQLYGPKGTVWAFADGPAKPFLKRDANRFSVVQTLGYSVPFTQQFLPMLNDAAGKRVEQLVTQQRAEIQEQNDKLAGQKDQLQAQLAVTQLDRAITEIKQKIETVKAQTLQLSITAQPTSVNPGAKIKPFLTTLSIQCASGARVMNNYNFPVSDSFPLGDRQCGEVTLQIKLDDIVLTKKYPGTTGVVRFLQDFRDGARQFNVDEFPAAKAKLDALGVRQIGLRYNFEGQDQIIKSSQLVELLDKQEKEKTIEKQRLQDAQTARETRSIQNKISNSGVPSSVEVSVPKQIGVCWDAKLLSHKPQDIQALFKDLAAAQVRMPAAAASSPKSGTGSGVGAAQVPAGSNQ